MQAILAIVFAYLVTNGGLLIIRLLLGAGFGYVTYTGASYAITTAETFIYNQMGGISAAAYSIVKIAGFDQGIHIAFAGWAAAIAVKTSLGVFKRFVHSS